LSFPDLDQTRFPATGAYIDLFSSVFFTPLNQVLVGLNYTDGEDFSIALTSYTTGLVGITNAFTDPSNSLTRVTFELSNLLVWSLYPAP
jgi:hypothetical protein